MTAEALISRYNHLNGQAVLVSTLKEFHQDIQRYLDSKGSGPFVTDLKGIYTRVTRVLKSAGGESRIQLKTQAIDLTPAEEKSVVKAVAKKPALGKVKETPKQEKKVAKVLHEFKKRKLKTPAGKTVTEKDQAVAIALREAGVPKKVRAGKLGGVLSGDQISKMAFRKIPITGKYQHDFGHLYNDTQVMIWGPPGGGKTVYVLELAQYMAEKLNLKVLFIANEEMNRSSFTEKIREFKIGDKNLLFAKSFEQLKKSGYSIQDFDAIFFDSVQSIGMDLDAYKKFVEENPGRIYVLIAQSTKEGDFRGGKDWEHEVDIAGEVVNRKLILRKNRLDKGFYGKSRKLMKEKKVDEQKFKNEIKAEVKKTAPIAEPKAKAA